MHDKGRVGKLVLETWKTIKFILITGSSETCREDVKASFACTPKISVSLVKMCFGILVGLSLNHCERDASSQDDRMILFKIISKRLL